MNTNLKIIIYGLSCLGCTSFTVMADEYHYNNMLIGDRASGLGGAYTAISDDAGGLYYNPAGLVYSQDLKLSASVNAYHTSTQRYKGVLKRGDDWVRKSSTLVPNFFGMTQKLGPGYFGFSYAVTNSDVENQDSIFRGSGETDLIVVNFNNRDTTTKIGPSYAVKIADNFNIGATLYFHSREKEAITNQWVRFNDNTYDGLNTYFQTSETGINPILGLLWSPTDEISLGLSVRKTLILSSDTDKQSASITDKDGGSSDDPILASSTEKRELPMNIRAGIAYFPNNRFLMDFDVSYYGATTDFLSSTEQTVNLAAGVEFYYDANWAFRGGVFSNNSNTPTIKSGGTDQLDHVDLTGFSVSLTRFTKASSITAGFTYSAGNGSAQLIGGSTDIQDLEFTSSTFHISTSYQF